MKFELVEFDDEDEASGKAPDPPEEEIAPPAEGDDDPAAGVNAAAARLTGSAHVEGQRIDASLAELGAILQKPVPGRPGAAPPANFRAGRFSKGER